MKSEEIIAYLTEQAPLWQWELEGTRIRGTTIINGKKMSGITGPEYHDSVKLFTLADYDKDILQDIIEGFRIDYERKKNAKDIR
jgi:hypothetical protein